MTQDELDIKAIRRAMKELIPRYPKGDLRNLDRVITFRDSYDKAVKEILEEEHDRI